MGTKLGEVGARILVTGASGQVGGELVQSLAGLGEVIAPSRAELDLSDEASVRAMVRHVKPRWIVNPGAYTAVDRAESESELAYAVNATAVRALGEEAKAIGAAVVHFSTDYVFDGEGTAPYRESDPVHPTSVYGASKLAGEQELARSGAAHLIFRTSWVYGATGKNFLRTILKAARERDRLRVVADQHGAPTWSRDLARMTEHVIGECERRFAGAGTRDGFAGLPDAVTQVGGVYHAAGAGETTWHGFAAEAVRQQAERTPEVRLAEIDPIATVEYPTPARRPANSRLDCGKLNSMFGWSMMRWEESLRAVLAELAAPVSP
ncbi:MAG TPA: dTDP-4-dehydrorhamnose reductase [Granulicella sp.]|nr:dTDP-4-dehydrorhamnose reductase [Granulicella sp.]